MCPSLMVLVKYGCFSLNIQNRKNDTSLFSFRNIKIMAKLKKNDLEILVQTALVCGPILDNSENNPYVCYTVIMQGRHMW